MEYIFANADQTSVKRSDGTIIPWNPATGGPAGGGQVWQQWEDDGAPVPDDYVAPAPTKADVNAERDRRIMAGKTFTVTGYGDIAVSGDATTQLNLLALKDTARDLKAASVTAAVIPYRDADNAQHMLTADQIIELVNAGKTHVQMLYSASWTLKAMAPIPADFADDSYWS